MSAEHSIRIVNLFPSTPELKSLAAASPFYNYFFICAVIVLISEEMIFGVFCIYCCCVNYLHTYVKLVNFANFSPQICSCTDAV